MGDNMKKKLMCLLITILLLVVIPTTGSKNIKEFTPENPQPIATDNWPMFGHDSAHTGFSTSLTPDTNDTLWINTTGGVIQFSPIIVNDMIYFGSFDRNLYCLDAFDGTQIWVNSTGNGVVYSSPIYVDGKIIAGATDGIIYCFDAINGSINWTTSIGGLVLSSPSSVENRIYFGTSNGLIICLDATDGSIIWDEPVGMVVWSSPAAVNDKLYIGLDNGTISCYNAYDGSIIWMNYTDGGATSPTVFESNVFVVSENGFIYCYDAIDGTLLWSNSTGGEISFASPAIASNKLYIGTLTGNFSCFSSNDGTLIWRNSANNQIRSPPAIADNKVYIGSIDQSIYCFDANSGDKIWSYITGGIIESSPVIYEGNVYVGSNDCKLYCFGISDQPPTVPVINGPHAAGPGFHVDFTTVSSDPESNQMFYMWDFGDGNITDWLGPYESGEIVSIENNWTYEGEYEIRVKAKDETELESDWSDPFDISIAEQISISNIRPGFIYFRSVGANNSYLFFSILEQLGVSAVIGDEGLRVETETSEFVNYTSFEVVNYIWGDNLTVIDYDGSNGFAYRLELPGGLWKLTVNAFDSNGNLIDTDVLNYLFYRNSASGDEQQLLRHSTLRSRMRDRLFNH